MSRRIAHLFRSESGSAAAEMALVTPLLLTLMFGSFELGNYFLDDHVVAKAVRDGARYAARKDFSYFTACSGEPTGTVATETKNLVRTGQVASGGTARLPHWDSPSTITITVTCNGTFSGGVYRGQASGAPVVTVSAVVPYSSLFNSLGFSSSSLSLQARAQASVMGI